MPLLRDRHAKECETRKRQMDEMACEPDDQKIAKGATPAGDERRLRGIPAIGRGVGGAIPGTRPDVT